MECANCRATGEPAYTLRAHVDADGGEDGESDADTRTDGGTNATVDLPFCSLECLTAWT